MLSSEMRNKFSRCLVRKLRSVKKKKWIKNETNIEKIFERDFPVANTLGRDA